MAKDKRPASSSVEASLPLGAEPVSSPDEIVAAPAVDSPEAGAPLTEATDLLPTEPASPEALAAGTTVEGLDAEPQETLQGPRVKVWPHGGLDWDGVLYEANLVFVVDTKKHREEDFLKLIADGVLLKPE